MVERWTHVWKFVGSTLESLHFSQRQKKRKIPSSWYFITASKRSFGQGNIFTGSLAFYPRGVSVCCHFLSGCLVPCSLQQGISVPCPIFLLAEGFLSRGVSVQEAICPGGSLSGRLSVQGVSLQGFSVQRGPYPGSLCPGIFVQGNLCPRVQGFSPRILCTGCLHPERSLSRGVSVRGGLCQGNSNRETPPTVKSGRYGGVMQLIEMWLLGFLF